MDMKSISKGCRLPDGPAHILIDSTGLKIYSAGEWLQEKHKVKARRSWRKLHLAVDAESGTIMAATLTGNDAGDPSQVTPLLDQIESKIGSVTADGAPTYAAIAARAGAIPVIIPPHVTAVLSDDAALPHATRPAHCFAGGQRSARLAEGNRLRKTSSGGNDHGPLLKPSSAPCYAHGISPDNKPK